MDAGARRIWEMMGALSDAFWRRVSQSGVSILEVLHATEYRPESAEEMAIWTELTAPHNYADLLRYLESWEQSEISEYAAKLNETILAEATRRREGEFGPVESDRPRGNQREGSPSEKVDIAHGGAVPK